MGFQTALQRKKMVTLFLGVKQVGSRAIGDTGELVTFLVGRRVSRNPRLPLFVFSRDKIHDAPAGSFMASGKCERG